MDRRNLRLVFSTLALIAASVLYQPVSASAPSMCGGQCVPECPENPQSLCDTFCGPEQEWFCTSSGCAEHPNGEVNFYCGEDV